MDPFSFCEQHGIGFDPFPYKHISVAREMCLLGFVKHQLLCLMWEAKCSGQELYLPSHQSYPVVV